MPLNWFDFNRGMLFEDVVAGCCLLLDFCSSLCLIVILEKVLSATAAHYLFLSACLSLCWGLFFHQFNSSISKGFCIFVIFTYHWVYVSLFYPLSASLFIFFFFYNIMIITLPILFLLRLQIQSFV